MKSKTTFLLDTNVFIEAYRRYYALDLCPGFWECLMHYCKEPRLLSIDRVCDEIKEGDDLDTWVRQAPKSLFASTADPAVVKRYSELMAWVQKSPQFRPEAKAAFARGADGWLIAYAVEHGYAVVTHEAFDPGIKRKVPIANICQQFGVRHVDTFDMLRTLEVRFGWDRAKP
ncbi:MAG: DUF4411 family protein [Caldilinea sp.]|nr:DUF4411 family protein [Caldilinea sp.]MDW8441046.1 DUF4411 family protein [Caldilineaceae bacterium]